MQSGSTQPQRGISERSLETISAGLYAGGTAATGVPRCRQCSDDTFGGRTIATSATSRSIRNIYLDDLRRSFRDFEFVLSNRARNERIVGLEEDQLILFPLCLYERSRFLLMLPQGAYEQRTAD
jgi:hypothetical protein